MPAARTAAYINPLSTDTADALAKTFASRAIASHKLAAG